MLSRTPAAEGATVCRSVKMVSECPRCRLEVSLNLCVAQIPFDGAKTNREKAVVMESLVEADLDESMIKIANANFVCPSHTPKSHIG